MKLIIITKELISIRGTEKLLGFFTPKGPGKDRSDSLVKPILDDLKKFTWNKIALRACASTFIETRPLKTKKE